MYQRLRRRAEDLPRAQLLRERNEVGASSQLDDRTALLAELDHPLAATDRCFLVRLYRIERPPAGSMVDTDAEPREGDLVAEPPCHEDVGQEVPVRPFLRFSPRASGIPSRLHTSVIDARELERCYTPHHRWRCLGCRAALTLQHGDPRLGSGTAPRCARCGAWTAPVHPDVVPARPS